MKKVLIPTKLDPVAREILEAEGEYSVVQDDRRPLEELALEHTEAYALIVRSEKVTPEIMDAMPGLRVIIRAGAGYNTIDTRYARKRKIDVMNTPGANANAVAEEVIALMLADARHVVEADASTRAGRWEKKRFMGREITGKTVGIVGCGAIGRLVAKRLEGFQVRLLGYDPVLSEERARDLGLELVSIEALFEGSDYITLHLPENNETRGMVNRDLLGRMKKGATLVNCARAGVINEDDLRAVKAEKGLRFLNDVYPKDAEGPKSIADCADLLMPHLGASTHEANYNAAKRAAEELVEFDEKGITSYIVNRDIPEGLDEAYGELAYTLARVCRALLGREAKLKEIETSIYGSLKPFAPWLLVPMAAALDEGFDRSSDATAALTYLEEMGVEYQNRDTDDRKGYGNSITIDLTAHVGGDTLRHVSVRGTVTEGNVTIARINAFDKLYFEPYGHTVGFIYDDRPGILSRIASALAAADINIDDVRNPHDKQGTRSIAILKVNKPVPRELVESLGKDIQAHTAFVLTLNP
jgi:D-3-phosphoglycerate dehydrogenase / 2-oxoglutarate reductase